MTLSDLLHTVNLKLGEQNAFYPPAEVLRSGINPAQRLLCLMYPHLLRSRTTVVVPADLSWVNLLSLSDAAGLSLSGRIRRVNRVMIGNVTANTPVRSTATGELIELRRTSLEALRWRPNWLGQRGEVREYWTWGKFFVGLYKRPIAQTTLTIVFDMIPPPLVLGVLSQQPAIAGSYHFAIADIAANLLLMKEGLPQGAQALKRIKDMLQTPEEVARASTL